MKRKLKSFFNGLIQKKRDGNLGDVLGTAMCMLIMLTVLLVMIQYMNILFKKREVANLGREFLLILEEQGELKADDLANLQTKINQMGYNTYTVTFNGDNHKKNYGQEVSIEIRITATRQEMNLTLAIVPGLVQNTYNLDSKLYSIAKH